MQASSPHRERERERERESSFTIIARALFGAKYCKLAAARLSGEGVLMGIRGYSVPAAAVRKSLEEGKKKKKQSKRDAISLPVASWVPDPVTGYYRLVNSRGDTDASEMRDQFLRRSSQG